MTKQRLLKDSNYYLNILILMEELNNVLTKAHSYSNPGSIVSANIDTETISIKKTIADFFRPMNEEDIRNYSQHWLDEFGPDALNYSFLWHMEAITRTEILRLDYEAIKRAELAEPKPMGLNFLKAYESLWRRLNFIYISANQSTINSPIEHLKSLYKFVADQKKESQSLPILVYAPVERIKTLSMVLAGIDNTRLYELTSDLGKLKSSLYSSNSGPREIVIFNVNPTIIEGYEVEKDITPNKQLKIFYINTQDPTVKQKLIDRFTTVQPLCLNPIFGFDKETRRPFTHGLIKMMNPCSKKLNIKVNSIKNIIDPSNHFENLIAMWPNTNYDDSNNYRNNYYITLELGDFGNQLVLNSQLVGILPYPIESFQLPYVSLKFVNIINNIIEEKKL